MFKKIQRHRYMNIIRSIQLEKSIKIKHYNRMEEKLNLKMERLTKVRQIKSENLFCDRNRITITWSFIRNINKGL